MDSIAKLAAIADASDIAVFEVPLVYIKGKTILTLNTSNQMMYRQRMAIKNKYKKIIEPTIRNIVKFDCEHQHIVMQLVFSDRRDRDKDNQIYTLKYIQDSLVENGKLIDDKFVSFTVLPSISRPELEEHYCEVTIIDLCKNGYIKKESKND